MTATDFPFALRRWHQKALAALLGEAFLGFLAIVAAALTLAPMLFKVSPSVDALMEAGQWIIVAVFALEYVLGFCFTPLKRRYALNPWRLLDLTTIVLPLVTLVPGVSGALLSTPVLRLLRLIRLVTLGVRASGVIVREESRRAVQSKTGPVEITMMNDGRASTPQQATWDEFLRWIRSPGPAWYSAANIGPEEAGKIALAAGMPAAFIESHLLSTSYPHLELSGPHAALFVWLPETQPGTHADRNGLLVLISETSLVTLARRPTRLVGLAAALPAPDGMKTAPFPIRMTCQLLKAVRKRNEDLVGRFELELRALEEVPVRESRPTFFEQAFRLKKELSTAQSDLWRLKSMLSQLAEGRSTLPGSDGGEIDILRRLAEDVSYLYDTVANTREGVLSLIDLHLNVVSFEMNRVMRVLAVVSVLGLIPAVVGGLFGMNLADNPWPLTLPQVSFGVGFGMIVCFYFFLVKGWLR